MDIETLLSGESKNVAYKLTPPSRSINYTKTAVALASCQGGSLVFGVEDGTPSYTAVTSTMPASRSPCTTTVWR